MRPVAFQPEILQPANSITSVPVACASCDLGRALLVLRADGFLTSIRSVENQRGEGIDAGLDFHSPRPGRSISGKSLILHIFSLRSARIVLQIV
jgi:hypothetical protein